MSILTKQYSIDAAFLKRPWKELTYNEIKTLSGKSSRSYIYRSLNYLLSENIIQSRQIGKSVLYSPDLTSLKAKSYLALLEEYRAWSSRHIPLKVIYNLSNLLLKVTPFFTFIITGSYAKKTQKKSSDLDVAIICDESIEPKKINAELSLEGEISIPPAHLYVFKKSEFLAMLLDKKENYGKEIVRHHLIFAGSIAYYSILQEAVQNGFRG